MAVGESTSPLFAESDRALASGRGRSALGRSNTASSFPIKKIAFKAQNTNSGENNSTPPDADGGGGGGDSNNATTAIPESSAGEPRKSLAQLRAERQQQEEFEAMKREAREAGLHACNLAKQGIIPGLVYDDGESTKVIGSGDSMMPDAKKAKAKKKHKKNNVGKKKDKVVDTATQQNRYEEEKEEITGEEEVSVPLTAAATTRTEMDNTTTASQGSKSSKSSFFDPKRLFNNKNPDKKKRKQTKKAKKGSSPTDHILQEAQDLLNSGAWMCGVCGNPFDTSEHANRHEKQCLIEWLKHDKLVRQSWKDQGKPKNTTDVPIMYQEHDQPLDYPEYMPPRTGGEVPISSPMVKKYLLMTDEALISVARRQKYIMHEVIDRDLCELSLKKQRAREMGDQKSMEEYTDHDKQIHEDLFIWEREYDALQELEFASRDRHYYATLEQRAMERRYGRKPHLTHQDYYYHRLNRIQRAGGDDSFNMESAPEVHADDDEKDKFSPLQAVKGRFENAYKLVKEGPASQTDVDDKSKVKSEDGDTAGRKGDVKHDNDTLYINVVVKNSVQMVNNELQRIARGWWTANDQVDKEEVKDFQFEWIRANTQKHVIRLAGMALASDFTPRKVAVQLSKDLYSNLVPQLKPRGVDIQAVVEYREGQYFVFAVNVLEIDWVRLMAWVQQCHDVQPNLSLGTSLSKRTSGDDPKDEKEKKKKKEGIQKRVKTFLRQLRQRFPSRNEVVAYYLFFMHRVHVLIAVPLMQLLYILGLRYAVNKFILNAVTDDIFHYVERKGMELQLGIKRNNDQASFMLAVLREIRNGEKKRLSDADDDEEGDQKPIIGPLMGPAIKEDNNDAKVPDAFTPPDVLEFIGLETDLPVGFLRLRWALMHSSSTFLKDAFYVDVMAYDKVEMQQWSVHENDIGLPKATDGVDESSFIGATLEYSYLMPKSAFVKANMCYATLEITHYDDHCLVMKEKTLAPEVPYGNTFIAWTQYSFVNTGKNTCRMTCSVEAEFPNGQPMVARQIKSGMRSGTAEKFVSLGETVCRYAEASP